ncbi:hypothetical protein pb186bvf_003660 [Paramecium bursaria]
MNFFRSLIQLPKYGHFQYEKAFGQVGKNPAITAKRIIKVVGERLRQLDPQRWETTPITFKTTWRDERGFIDVATCIHIHDALEKEFGIDIKDRAFIVADIETAFYIVTLHHDSI